jgi:COP9 signalosome complex subunit 8
MRLPTTTQAHPLAQSLFGLLASVSERRHAHVYERAESLYNQSQTQDFPDAELGAIVVVLTRAFVGTHSSSSEILSDFPE